MAYLPSETLTENRFCIACSIYYFIPKEQHHSLVFLVIFNHFLSFTTKIDVHSVGFCTFFVWFCMFFCPVCTFFALKHFFTESCIHSDLYMLL